MIASLIKKNDNIDEISQNDIYNARVKLDIIHQYNEVDTCAAEFQAITPYLYSTIPPIKH